MIDQKQARQSDQNDQLDSLIMFGNSGVGKSTILNGLVGETLFTAGVSLGEGMTSCIQEEIYNGRRYFDTPALSDDDLQKQSAEAITKVLRKGGNFRIFFVVTLEAGRIRPDDKTTMKLVLEAAPEIREDLFSIIINKASATVKDLMSKKEGRAKMLTKMNYELPTKTKNIFVNAEDGDLHDKTNVLPILSKEFLQFLLQAPSVNIKDYQQPKNIDIEKFEKTDAQLAKQIALLEEDKELTEKRMMEQAKQLEALQMDLIRREKEPKKKIKN